MPAQVWSLPILAFLDRSKLQSLKIVENSKLSVSLPLLSRYDLSSKGGAEAMRSEYQLHTYIDCTLSELIGGTRAPPQLWQMYLTDSQTLSTPLATKFWPIHQEGARTSPWVRHCIAQHTHTPCVLVCYYSPWQLANFNCYTAPHFYSL